mgnify:CR=1 FL=1
MYKHTDYFKKYGRIMQFNKNKKEPFHRWYPFVEGYSKEFIQSIVKEMDRNNLVCLEPFSGSGTTALELQNCGIACFAFEVNPLMYLIARVKLENGYELERFEYWYDYIVKERSKKIVELETEFNTLYQGEGKKKWNYNTDIGIAVEKLRQVIESISEVIYKELFKVALAAILLDVEIAKLKQSQLYHIEIVNDGQYSINSLGDRNVNESQIINMVTERFKDYKGYCFIVDAGMQYLFVNGKVDENINSCFQKTRTMQAKLDVLKPISGIREVFAHFIVECVYKKDNYNICFDYLSGKVKAEIKEQDLRNILLQYLEKNMRGEVSVEFCTDYLNDEESVDIYIYDGCQRAIIEVKFSLPEKYYAGSTHYSITARTGDGIKQLDKYARHLAKDGRLVDFGYVYMFYMSDVKKETLMSRIDNKTNELLRGLSDELNSIFDGVEMNDMKCWGTAS